MAKPTISARFRAQDEELLFKLCEEKSRRAIASRGEGYDNISVSMLPRFGYSGARLFVVTFTKRDSPSVFKIAPYRKACGEMKAINSMDGVGVEDCTRVRDGGVGLLHSDDKKWGGILYPHMGVLYPKDADESVTLKQRLFSAEKPLRPLSLERLKSVLTQVFQQLWLAHCNPDWKSVLVKETYDSYFRDHRSESRIREILGSAAGKPRIDFLHAKQLYNPLKLVEDLPRRAQLPMARVHGDLHPDNVVLHKIDGAPHLIDFAWAERERDVLVDFVLMENSIRFRDFPRTANLEEQLKLDRALVQNQSFEAFPPCNSWGEDNQWAYDRLSTAIPVIRNSAKMVLGDGFSVERYLFCQFIVLYGLLRYDAYDPYISLQALALMAERLRDAGWGFLEQTASRLS
ncbi:MAG TPA: phosphotransferase [Verrucomicrobiae bacterium]|jgi:serine/threonine protein kinase|nr:phosphotransferase [Verrucomicrobiae bacterium]